MTTTMAHRRSEMVKRQLAARGIRGDRVLNAMKKVPRERFVPSGMQDLAYRDSALPIEADQTISQPYVVALMAEALEIQPRDRVLEVGAGSGYAAAVLSHLADEVFAVERHDVLAEAADERMRALGLDNVHIRRADGTLGWEGGAPFNAILVSAGGTELPPALVEQLAPGGRLIIPLGEAGSVQELFLHRKDAEGRLSRETLGQVRFVPLVGAPSSGRQDAYEAVRQEPT